MVDEADAGGTQASEFTLDVVRAVRDVVHGLTSAFEESTDCGVRAERLEEFDGAEEGHPNPLGFQDFRRGTDLA